MTLSGHGPWVRRKKGAKRTQRILRFDLSGAKERKAKPTPTLLSCNYPPTAIVQHPETSCAGSFDCNGSVWVGPHERRKACSRRKQWNAELFWQAVPRLPSD